MLMRTLGLLTLTLGMSSAFANSPISYTEEHIVIDLNAACYNRGQMKECDLNQYGIDAVLVSSNDNLYSKYEFSSSIPVMRVDYKCQYSDECGSWVGSTLSGSGYTSTFKNFEYGGVDEFTIDSYYGSYPTKVYLDGGIPTQLNASLSSASNILLNAYQGVKRNLVDFRSQIAKSHRGHMDRFNLAVDTGISLLEEKENGRPKYSVVNYKVQENARLVVVFGSVLDELLTDYDDINSLKNSISAMRTLVAEMRKAYGWQNGLAGTVSKAASSLIDVIRLELQEIASIKMAMGSDDLQVYFDLLRVTRSLQAKVNASNSGDMRAQREIWDVLDIWNSKAWQEELESLIEAGPDYNNLVLPKVQMLLYSIESVEDLTESGFIIPGFSGSSKG